MATLNGLDPYARVGRQKRVGDILTACLRAAVRENHNLDMAQCLVHTFGPSALSAWCDAADLALEVLMTLHVAPATRTALEDLLVPVCHGAMQVVVTDRAHPCD